MEKSSVLKDFQIVGKRGTNCVQPFQFRRNICVINRYEPFDHNAVPATVIQTDFAIVF
jgi:hypothetical protein